ncbi:MAG: hypothetical protein ABI778_06420 [Ignavibacteriota bacterium]
MKLTLTPVILFALFVYSGCDQPTHPATGGTTDGAMLAWVQTMTKVKVTYSGNTNIHSYLKQGTRDPGNTADVWFPREMEFSNWDSTYTINWQGSQFQTKSCFVFRQINPSFTLSSGCGDQSIIRGTFDAQNNSISNIYCAFSHYQAGIDPMDYREQDASLLIPEIKMSSYGEDSIEFTVQDWKPGSISMGYNYNETAYTTFLKELHLRSYDTTGTEYPNVCRVVFYSK